MKFEMVSEVTIKGIGKVKHTHTQEFDDNSNVFGRVAEYHEYMYKTFPQSEFRLIKAREI